MPEPHRRIARSLAYLSLLAVLVVGLLAGGPVLAAPPTQDELVRLAAASLHDGYDVLITGQAQRPLVEKSNEFGQLRNSAERLADTLRRREINAAYGLRFVSAQLHLIDLSLTAESARIIVKATEEVRLSFQSGSKPHDPARDVTIMRIPHTFTFAGTDAGWQLVLDEEEPFPISPHSPPIAPMPQPARVRPVGSSSGPKPGLASPRAAGYYSWSAAADYLRQFALSYNSAYRRFDGDAAGGDCTNFISQALRAGGWQDKLGWYLDWNNWWYNDANQTRTWTYAPAMFQFMQTSGRATFLQYLNDLWVGDVLQLDFDRDGTMDHTMGVDDKTSSDLSGIFLSYHTRDTYHRALSDIYASNPSANYYAERITGTY